MPACLCSALVSGVSEDLSSCAGAGRGSWCFWYSQGLILQVASSHHVLKELEVLSTLQVDGNSFINLFTLSVTLCVINNHRCVRAKPLIPSPLTLLLLFLILDPNSLLQVLSPIKQMSHRSGLSYARATVFCGSEMDANINSLSKKPTPASSW